MAVTAREVIMVFRGQNYLSGAIRRVSTDVAGLSRLQQAQIQRAAIAGTQARMALAQKAAQAELRSVQVGGTRYIASQKLIQQSQLNIARTSKMIGAQDSAITQARIARVDAYARRQSAQQRADEILGKNKAKIESESQKLIGKGSEAEKAAASANIKAMQEQNLAAQGLLARKERDYAMSTQSVRTARLQKGILQDQLAVQKIGLDKANVSQEKLVASQGLYKERINQASNALALQNIRLAQSTAIIDTIHWQNFRNMAQWIEHASHVVQMFSLITSATFGFLAKSAADFNTQVVMASTQSTVAGKNTVAQVMANSKQIGNAIQQMMLSGTTIAKPQDLTESIYNIFSGVTLSNNQQTAIKQGVYLLKQFNDVMKANAGMVTMNEVTQAGITLLNVFRVSVDKMPVSLNRMQAAVRFMKGNMSDFISTMNQGAPAAKQAGYSFDQFAGSMAAASRWFPSIRFASTGYARLIDILLRNADSFEKSGIKITTAKGQLLDLSTIAANIIKKYPQLTTGGAIFGRFLKDVTNTQGTMQARRFLTMLIQNLDQYRTVTRQVSGDNNELTKSLKSAERSTGVTWSEFVNQIRAVILIIGEQAIPAFQKMGRPIVSLIHWFQRLSPEWKHIIGYWGSMISLGALLVSTFLSIAGGAGVLVASAVIWFKVSRAMDAAFKANQLLLASNAALTGSNEALAASGETVAVAETAAFKASTLATFGIITMIPLLIIFHKQVGEVIGSLGGWSQALILLGGALVAIKMESFIMAIASASGAMKLLMGTAGILGLIAIFGNFAHSADGLRHILDALFSGWAGYVITVIAMTAAVKALYKAMLTMQVVSKFSLLWSGLTAGALGFIGVLKRIPVLLKAVVTGQAISTAGALGTRSALLPGAQMLSGKTGFIGKEDVGLTALAMGIRSFIPMLAVGGALMGGLYLWKRYLDNVHDAQAKVKRMQDDLNRSISSDKTLSLLRRYGQSMENVGKAQLDLADARRQYAQDIKSGASTETLTRDIYALADAQRAYDNALSVSRSGLNAWNQSLENVNKVNQKMQIYLKNIGRLNSWIYTYIHMPGELRQKIEAGGKTGVTWFDQITKILGIKNYEQANAMLKRYLTLYDTAKTKLPTAQKQFLAAIQSTLKDFERTKVIPQMGPGAFQAMSQYMTGLKQAPSFAQLKLIAKASIALDPTSIKTLPSQYEAIVSKIYGEILLRKPLTKAQIRVLISVLLGIDPNSKIGKQLQLIMAAVVKAIEKSGGLKVGWMDKGQNEINKILNNAVAANAKANLAQATATQNRTKYQYAAEWKMWNQIQEIVKLHQRAIATGSYKDLVAYYAKLEKVQGQYQGASLQAFNSMLDAQETALNNSVTKQKATYENVLSGLQNMYQNFQSQEQNAFGGIGQGPWMTSGLMQVWQQWGGVPNARDYQKDINEQISQYQRRNRMLGQLMKRGAPAELLKQIQSLPADQANAELKAMTSMAPGQLKRYFNSVNTAQKLINQQTMRDLNNQLDQYKKYGKGIAAAIVAGLTSENQAMEKALKRLIMKVFPGLPHEATGGGGGPPPPKKPPKPPHYVPTTGPKLPPGVTTGPNLPALRTDLPKFGDWVKQASKIFTGDYKVLYSDAATNVRKVTKKSTDVANTATKSILSLNAEATTARIASVNASSSMAKSVNDVAVEAVKDLKKITDHIVNPPGSKKHGVSTKPTTVNHNTVYQVNGVSENASIETKLRHADFQRRNKYRVNI